MAISESKCESQYPVDHNTPAGLHHLGLHAAIHNYKKMFEEVDKVLATYAGPDVKKVKELRERIGYVIGKEMKEEK